MGSLCLFNEFQLGAKTGKAYCEIFSTLRDMTSIDLVLDSCQSFEYPDAFTLVESDPPACQDSVAEAYINPTGDPPNAMAMACPLHIDMRAGALPPAIPRHFEQRLATRSDGMVLSSLELGQAAAARLLTTGRGGSPGKSDNSTSPDQRNTGPGAYLTFGLL
ncbi:unnamed protein product [Protopolystoma xenopodis]|uniref:Uncharacterized protein n=1 Tax=Protopolystoma xenopodis TaxID=117903 RepID=A0A3S5AS10_9PLAT|nr:unnamed protein product [Protopolystoma xenopodis]